MELRTNGSASAPPINADEEEQPHDVHEVPVPCCRLEAEMMIGLEVSGHGAKEVHDEETRADDDMEAVEPRRHEEGRRIDPVFETKGSVAVFIGLQRAEAEAEEDRDTQPLDELPTVVHEKCAMSPAHCEAGSQQNDGVEERDFPGIEGVDALGRPDAVNGKEARAEKCPEEGGKEHHFRDNEKRHAIAQPDLHHGRVMALKLRLADHVAPPREHGGEHTEEAGREGPDRPAMHI